MLLITNRFTFSAFGIGVDNSLHAKVTIISSESIKNFIASLVTNSDSFLSLVSTKTAAKDFSKRLGIDILPYSGKFFTIEDQLKISIKNKILYGESSPGSEVFTWYLVEFLPTPQLL